MYSIYDSSLLSDLALLDKVQVVFLVTGACSATECWRVALSLQTSYPAVNVLSKHILAWFVCAWFSCVSVAWCFPSTLNSKRTSWISGRLVNNDGKLLLCPALNLLWYLKTYLYGAVFQRSQRSNNRHYPSHLLCDKCLSGIVRGITPRWQ